MVEFFLAFCLFSLVATGACSLRNAATPSSCFRACRMPTRTPTPDHVLFSAADDETDRPRSGHHDDDEVSPKRIVLIRHGQTFMNEYIGSGGIRFGRPGFTDVFSRPDDRAKFHDSPLSAAGIRQAVALRSRLGDWKDNQPSDASRETTTHNNHNFLDDLELVVVSPLTRALQTLELSLGDHVSPGVPIVAVAAAAERLYLVSDLGRPRSELRPNYPRVDFETAFFLDGDSASDGVWHYSAEAEDACEEWRPQGEGQVYACPGEPQEHFDRRMSDLYHWLDARDERCIAVVCHAGVIDWMTSGEEFANCELRVVAFDGLRPRNLQPSRE